MKPSRTTIGRVHEQEGEKMICDNCHYYRQHWTYPVQYAVNVAPPEKKDVPLVTNWASCVLGREVFPETCEERKEK